jgi:dienelactone hydrolase
MADTIEFAPSTRPDCTLIVLPDVSGVNDDANRSFCSALSTRGFHVVMLDIYRGAPWSSSANTTYEAWRAQHPADRIDADVVAAVHNASQASTAVGLVGLCFGGGAGWRAAQAGIAGLDVAVLCYPTRVETSAALRTPTLVILAEDDACAIRWHVARLRAPR